MNSKKAKRIRAWIDQWNIADYIESKHPKEKAHIRVYNDFPIKVVTKVLSPECGRFLYKRAKKYATPL